MRGKQLAILAVVLICSSSMLLIIENFNENKSTITYCVDGEEYLSINAINNTILKHPIVPEKLGFYGEWDVEEQVVTSDLTINAIYTRYAYVIRFETDYPDFFDICVYDTDDYKNPNYANYGYSRNSKTGDTLIDGNGQLNFSLNSSLVDAIIEIEGGLQQNKNQFR